MPRNISFSLTTPQFIARTKTVTRRVGWNALKAGDKLMGCEKCMGRKPGEPLVRLGMIEVVSVRREPLMRMTQAASYGFKECVAEGFGDDPRLRFPSEFVKFFCDSHVGCTPATQVTRIEFKYL
jgi:hypothetical protein